jgi:hypothetical protein
MRFILGFLSGVLGLLAGWSGLAALVMGLAGPDRDGGVAMGAFFNIGPIGGLAGFVAGVMLFIKFGIVSQGSPPSGAEPSDTQPSGTAQPDTAPPDTVPPDTVQSDTVQSRTAPAAARTRVSPVFAVAVLAITSGLGWWGWYEFIRSPYLTHGFMKLELQFKLPPGMALPGEATDVHITVAEGQQTADVLLGPSWHGTVGDRRVILASATLDRKTSRRVVSLSLPGVAQLQSWQLDLATDPDPTPGYSPWRLASPTSDPKIEMNFSLSADR